MKRKRRIIRFSNPLSSRPRPSALSWFLLGAGLIVALMIPVLNIFAIAALIFFYLPAVIGSFFGWFFSGVRDEIQEVRSLRRIHSKSH